MKSFNNWFAGVTFLMLSVVVLLSLRSPTYPNAAIEVPPDALNANIMGDSLWVLRDLSTESARSIVFERHLLSDPAKVAQVIVLNEQGK